MRSETIFDKVRGWIGYIAWIVFLWSIRMTEEQFIRFVYEQELLNDRET